ncbi:MAG: hypothetical protein EOO09_17310 [Chitinophagaceae bacterium]|nr:MAG: hypothetical protein EOO09_17310 [Chitinophagaceae bacterium]
MCTVSFIPDCGRVYLSSNRDEKHTRPHALPPAVFSSNGYEIQLPLDPVSNGSWIAARNTGDAAVLLNGAFDKHLPLPVYRKSRGKVLIEIISAGKPVEEFEWYDCNNIEPFTLILYVQQQLMECRWDGLEKHIRELDANTPMIWSSATLYDNRIAKQRQHWFQDWLNNTREINTPAILDFHKKGGMGDRQNDLVMNRENQLYTVSITSICIDEDQVTMDYLDLKIGSQHRSNLNLLPILSTDGQTHP